MLTGEINQGNAGNVQPLAIWGNGRANVIRLSPNGQALAVGTDLGAVLYDSQTYIRLALWHTPNPVNAIAFSGDNRWIALGQRNGTLDIIDQASLTLNLRLIPEDLAATDQVIQTLAFSSNSDLLFLAEREADDLRMFTWDADTWQLTVDESISAGEGVYISPELDLIGVIDHSILNLQSLTYPEEREEVELPPDITPELLAAATGENGAILPSSNGDFLLFNTGESVIRWTLQADDFTYELSDFPTIPDPCNQAPVTCLNSDGGFSWECPVETIPPLALVALTPDNVMVLISRNDGQTEFRRASDTQSQWDIDERFTDVSFSPGGEFFFGLTPEGAIEKRSSLDGSLIDYIDQHPGELYDLAFSPDGGVLAAGFSDGWVRVFSTANGQMLGVLTGSARSLAFSPDGGLLAGGLVDGTVRLFNLNAGDYTDLRPAHLADVNDLAFSRNGEQLLTGSADCTAALWQVSDGERIRLLNPNGPDPFHIQRVDLSADGEWMFLSGNRPGITIFHGLERGNQLLSGEDALTDLTLSEEDNFLAAAGTGVWLLEDPTTDFIGESIDLSGSLTGNIAALAFSPDRSLLAVTSERQLAFWSTASQTQLASLALPQNALNGSQPIGLAFSPYGDLLALGTRNGLIHIFGIPIAPGE
jgi:WD40 repeat protein